MYLCLTLINTEFQSNAEFTFSFNESEIEYAISHGKEVRYLEEP